MILIGSRALLFRAPNLMRGEPNDFDFIGYESEIKDWLSSKEITLFETETNKIIVRLGGTSNCEFEIADSKPSSQLLINLVEKDPKTIKSQFGLIPTLPMLFTLKASHKYLKNSPHFWKTAVDYHKMKTIGLTIPNEYMEFFKLREKETYNYNHPKLNQSKMTFFDGDQIKYVYDHDSIHEAVKVFDVPAYTLYKKDGEEVACDKAKFFALSEEIRLAGVAEEAYVLALERSQIPFPGKMTPKQSFMLALSKVCSSITSGWFREYGYENIFKVIKNYNDSYLDNFNKAIDLGIVKKL